MKKSIPFTALVLVCAATVHAETTPTTNPNISALLSTPVKGSLCVITDTPPSDLPYKVVKRIKIAKGTYGSVTDLYPRLHETAKNNHADAVIHYRASQRFGFWPWRFVRPVIAGTAIQWKSPSAENCRLANGREL
ncbi:hypothetical protein E0H77_04155 [Acinetobacter sp. ANC 4633]|uniref:hypothetical protein n=1 Tax=Acinetobacter sp. ANC 4633 TaxID=2529845 RepID=UPI00103E5517|nr:hypothetical protein [Acinetobacter sp. ANC 4633]TCB27885.1 hypothetical protein E0H77_04155 [Acinetobacter sp. ANC 4633]